MTVATTLEELEWQLDCQGKQDYDLHPVDIGCRYYPGRYRQDGKPSCNVHISLLGKKLVSDEIVADAEAQVKVEVEKWVAEQTARLMHAIQTAW